MADNSRLPLQPKSVLRGHKAQVHAATFVRRNGRLVTGDAEGFVVVWDLTIMRPRTVWQAHSNAILGVAGWGEDRIITHGRDSRLVVWKLAAQDEVSLSTVLPLDPSPQERPQPWILHILEINTMNFCSFSSCPSPTEPTELLIAVPNTLASEAIDIFHLPSQRRIHTLKFGSKNGMVMALSLFHRQDDLVIVAAYENGLALAAQLNSLGQWELTYRAQAHSQPILSLDITPNKDSFFTSGADAMIAKHPIPHLSRAASNPARSTNIIEPTADIQTQPLKVVDTKHSGQQALRMRSDARIFATAGWDSRARVYSARTMREVAVLAWHSSGCYAAAFADVDPEPATELEAPGQVVTPAAVVDIASGGESSAGAGVVVPRLVDMTVRDRRIGQVKTAHWLAVGSKDGKVSLWDVF